jgi:cytochrome b561
VSATREEQSAAPAIVRKYTVLGRILHWLTAILFVAVLFIGFVMVNSPGHYATLVRVHEALGVTVLSVVIVRTINRLTHKPPALPDTVGRFERWLVAGSELALYALLIAQPVVGWAMVSASGVPVVVFGHLRLPAIAPVDAAVFSTLRETHSVLAYLLVAVVAAHVSAVLLHTIALGDGMLRRMTFGPFRRDESG